MLPTQLEAQELSSRNLHPHTLPKHPGVHLRSPPVAGHHDTQTALHAAGAPEEHSPYCICSQILPETSLQAIAGTPGPHVSLQGGHSTKLPTISICAGSIWAAPGRNYVMAWTAHPLDFLPRHCFRVAELCFVRFFVIINFFW